MKLFFFKEQIKNLDEKYYRIKNAARIKNDHIIYIVY